MAEDPQLLRRYVSDRSEDAFAEIVRRRIDLVYSVALRQVGGDAHLAKDVTQKVFADLARKAPTLLDRPVLSGWLYRSTQYAASDLVRSERRRRAREQETYAMQELTVPAESPPQWERLRPLLDDAMSELNDADRDAVALRFFENRAFAEIGRALQLTEEAARKRVERALDKLAAALSRHGVTSTSTALGAALIGQAAVAAPVGLATSVIGTALAGAGAVVAGGVFWTFMNSSMVSVGAGAVAVLAGGFALHESNEARLRSAELKALAGQHARAQEQVTALEQRLQSATQQLEASEKRAAAADEDTARLITAIQGHGTARAVPAMAAAPAPASSEPITHEGVQARYRRAQELARSGDPAEALRELLWCFDTGMVSITSFAGVRMSFLLSEIAKLGERFPPALEALRERRNQAEVIFRRGELESDATGTFASINHYLKEADRTIAAYDRLSPSDRRRSRLAMSAYDEFVEQRRYSDAIAGRSFAMMSDQFDRSAVERPLPAGITNPALVRDSQRKFLVATTAKSVEVLAGAGNLDQARTLANKLIGFDNSAETRAVLQRHVERAGRPDLLLGAPKS